MAVMSKIYMLLSKQVPRPSMWLLNTARAELHYFVSPEGVPGGYAILSHVWDAQNEQSFQDLQALTAQCRIQGVNPRDSPAVASKIRQCCRLAELHGYEWVWIDTCCIDKTSSAELSEAINSMFRYYYLAELCYAYLADVDDLQGFAESKWHTRGWTLQELLAPPVLLFISRDWTTLGSKADLATVVSRITGIPTTVLKFEEPLSNVSIAQRMSWAAFRQTTRLEDRAYSLMGIFGVNMPTLYGEGRRAFRRLQEEVMKQSVDTSLFAWGEELESKYLSVERFNPTASHQDHGYHSYLLAPSPYAFRYRRNTLFRPPTPINLEWVRIFPTCLVYTK